MLLYRGFVQRYSIFVGGWGAGCFIPCNVLVSKKPDFQLLDQIGRVQLHLREQLHHHFIDFQLMILWC